MSCPKVLNIRFLGSVLLLAASAVNPVAAVETHCGITVEMLTKLEEALDGQIAWLEANIGRLAQMDTGIESPVVWELVSHHHALLAEARDAQRTLADEIVKLKSASSLPAIECRNPQDGEVK